MHLSTDDQKITVFQIDHSHENFSHTKSLSLNLIVYLRNRRKSSFF